MSASSPLEVVRIPAWEKHPRLVHGFSTRTGGVTTVYQPGEGKERRDLNLGFTSSDTEENVLTNRRLFLEAVVGEKSPTLSSLVTLKQIHSTLLHRVGSEQAGERASLAGDGLMTDEPGVILGIQTADCIPVLIADPRRGVVAAFHAGWRGTLGRIVEAGVGRMRLEFGSRPEDLLAAIGPGIGQCCYSVGEEVLHQFQSQFLYADDLFREVYDSDPVKAKYPLLFLTARAPGHSNLGPSLHLDLKEANCRQLLDAGLQPDAISVVADCTSCQPERYFSHRGEHGFTGRMLSVVGLRAGG
ncbi:MAG TPA: peptidoglycan editing factor PgeF [Acidisarcina sp.]|nr:peptidoglycan editing factor PgeF [Acidisarcina sp.]